ncbi:hypothetical protein SAMN05444274_101522 [Mariniphaga anaerophila]|uniref:Uncharacterized protein n=1 Tax=Mariniphaga anaerophila TaxID=1484053 RepID=A0A1M4TZK6_9BACT|nr:hypothetical protein [Mariniphaga anaerophila]SHE49823.1 hypothetical protein SAMN05444274_101522 [Mariniphaga anaerophila]
MLTKETVAELTIFYKRQRLTSLIFDDKETADIFVETLTNMFNQKGHDEFSFNGAIKTVYTPDTISDELLSYAEGNISPKGWIVKMMKVIDGLN